MNVPACAMPVLSLFRSAFSTPMGRGAGARQVAGYHSALGAPYLSGLAPPTGV
jgi:hypothetical protein